MSYLRLALITLGATFAAQSPAALQTANPIVIAVRHGDCKEAAKIINTEARFSDSQIDFLAGRMLDEGICVAEDHASAARYYAHSAELGDQGAALDYAEKLGLGEGAAQNYEQAGETCRAAGLDPQHRLANYSLGYACTLRGLAGKLLRVSLPSGAFLPAAGAAVRIEFTPAGEKMRIRATPQVGSAGMVTGSIIARPLVDAKAVIENAWHTAQTSAPLPDASRLDSQVIELSLDVDNTLEAGRAAGQAGVQETLHPLLPGDTQRMAVP
ncbi:MAG TPA: hypothetical protein VF848_11000 [Steroidobacteraceae bacterium]